jgi:hypothetical protein
MFAHDGVLSSNEFTIVNGSFSSVTLVGSVLTLNLSGVVNAARLSVTLLGLVDAAGNGLSGTKTVTVRNLYGDVNRNGAVNVVDQQAVKNGLLLPVTASNYMLDVNASGTINVLDQQVIKNALLSVVP